MSGQQLIINPEVLNFLQRALTTGNIAPAYIFVGPAHAGKKTLATWFTQGLLCTAENKSVLKPCGQCPACLHVISGAHPDVHILDLLEGKRDIGIEQVHNLQEGVSQSSFMGGRKAVIIKNAERLSTPAANALLKTLEESHSQVTIVMLVDNLESLPATVVSRCQIIRLNPLPPSKIKESLLETGVEESLADKLANACGGRPGLAFNWLDSPEQLIEIQARGDQLVSILSGPKDSWPLLEDLAEQYKSLGEWQELMQQWQMVVHEAVLFKLGFLQNPFGASKNSVQKMSSWSWSKLLGVWTSLVNLGHNLDKNVNIRLALESFVLQNISYA